jgi:rod shape-determining protein MreD
MSRLLFAALVGASALIQATLIPVINPIQLQPNLVLVLVLIWTATHGVGEGVLWAGGVGFLLDLLSMDTLGTNGLGLLAVVLIGGFARRSLFHGGPFFPMLLTLVAALVSPLVVLILRDLSGGAVAFQPALRIIVPQALLATIVVPPLYVIGTLLDQRYSRVRL